jgi:hydroxyacylglutathione hydrolase
VAVVDVRGAAEWEAGHLLGVQNIPLGYLADRIGELPTDKPLVVQCEAGARSAIAASVLRAKGMENVVNLIGGFSDWEAVGNPVERGAAVAAGERVG